MKNLILLIFTEADLKAVPEAAARLKTMGIERLWILHNPHLGMPYPATAKALDEEITINTTGMNTMAARQNFTDAAKYRDAANDLRVKRDLEIKNAYKGIPQADIEKAYDAAFAPISQESTGIPNILREAVADPLSADQVFQYLHGQTAAWVDQFPHGEYAIFWIRALPEPAFQVADFGPHAVLVRKREARETPPEIDPDSIVALRARAKALGINSYQKGRAALKAEIAEREYALATA